MGARLNGVKIWDDVVSVGTEFLTKKIVPVGNINEEEYLLDIQNYGFLIQKDTIPILLPIDKLKTGVKISIKQIITWKISNGTSSTGKMKSALEPLSYLGYTSDTFEVKKENFNSRILIAESGKEDTKTQVYATIRSDGIVFAVTSIDSGKIVSGLAFQNAGTPGAIVGVVDSITAF